MKINKLIKKLKQAKTKHGNVKVMYSGNEYDCHMNSDLDFVIPIRGLVFTDKTDNSFFNPIEGKRIELL